jgi:MFS family permease
MLAALLTSLASAIAMVAGTVEWFYLVFILAATTVSLAGISRLGFVAEMCPETKRPTYIALTNMITSPFVLLGVLGGWIANRWGFIPVFGAAAVLALLSFIIWWLKIVDPRIANELEKEKRCLNVA